VKLYEVKYKANDWTDKVNTVRVVASNIVGAAQFVSKHKYTKYCGYVTQVVEIFLNVQIAK
jgi:hypothetical protein